MASERVAAFRTMPRTAEVTVLEHYRRLHYSIVHAFLALSSVVSAHCRARRGAPRP